MKFIFTILTMDIVKVLNLNPEPLRTNSWQHYSTPISRSCSLLSILPQFLNVHKSDHDRVNDVLASSEDLK